MAQSNPDLTAWFAEEVEPLDAAFRSWLKCRFPSLQDIDDVVQESYVRLISARRTGSIACAKAFLYITARNLALNRLRHLRHERFEDDADLETGNVLDETEDVPEAVAKSEDLQLLVQAIQSLPDRCRQVVTLRKIYGLTQKEVAAKMEISENTVEVQGVIGLRKCIEYFRRHGYGQCLRK